MRAEINYFSLTSRKISIKTTEKDNLHDDCVTKENYINREIYVKE